MELLSVLLIDRLILLGEVFTFAIILILIRQLRFLACVSVEAHLLTEFFYFLQLNASHVGYRH